MTNQNNDKSKNGKRIALILVALLLIAAIAFGAYTYSKYVSDASGSGKATVAKWGFNMSITDNSANGGDAFGFANDYSSSGTAQNSAEGAVISASTESTNIVAPGASGGLSFTIGNGTSEVQAKFTASLTRSDSIYLTITGSDSTTYRFYPIVYTMGETTGFDNVANTINALSKDSITPGQKIVETDTTYDIKWEWAFEATDITLENQADDPAADLTISDRDIIDQLDTILGKLAAGTTYATNPEFKIGNVTYAVDVDSNDTYSLTETVVLTARVEQTGITASGD